MLALYVYANEFVISVLKETKGDFFYIYKILFILYVYLKYCNNIISFQQLICHLLRLVNEYLNYYLSGTSSEIKCSPSPLST